MNFCVVDAGNTRVKVVDFENDKIIAQHHISISEEAKLQDVLAERKTIKSILSSVLNSSNTELIIQLLNPNVVLSAQTPLPISLDEYKTKETLGADRIANAVAAHHFSTTHNSLVIDVGTCIKFDLVLNSSYQGGSISPGYAMRLQAMHAFTGGLPAVNLIDLPGLLGKSTKESMLIGVNQGIQAEISGMIATYNQQFQPLTIFLTGGDHKRFELALKNSIFAEDNLTVKGLHIILKYNV